ncbi:MAG TPA: phosphate ABC transporter permease PstA [Candidatus Polarisedimenticolaceae bacterium]|nr:phosphate ABC transporter permease PstA [Candidatus Polarisedimenticolaceae bacterium]
MTDRRQPAALLGKAMTWLTGGALALNLLLVLGLLALLFWNGAGYFWPRPLVLITLADGEKLLGEVHDREPVPDSLAATRSKLKTGNRDLGGAEFRWIDDASIVSRSYPHDAVVLERVEWGNFYGFVVETLGDGGRVVRTADGARQEIPKARIVREVRPNALGLAGKLGVYTSRVREFLLDDPRESNTEGGIFPAIFGTVMMVFLMSFAVLPLGVLAALYLREYARQGPTVRVVRVAVNNLAGVPSIVFGVFGLGFFVYGVGGSIDRLFFAEALPTPTFGTGGILWAALTLALLTVPVVIVATEEGLAAVPRGVREGSLALGATKIETIVKVVLPAAAPGILTGMILAMARAAGEVAPLMIVGMVKLAPDLPLDGTAPYVHLERKFMHLGFHIFDVGFQSPNVEATKPLVFATALLLIAVVTVVNLTAIALRNRLRRKYTSSAV